MFYREKRKGATLAYVIVVLAIIAVIGTAIVSLSLTNYKAMIVHSKKTQNLYMSESGLDKVQKALDILTAKAITYGNDAVAKEDTSLSDIVLKFKIPLKLLPLDIFLLFISISVIS